MPRTSPSHVPACRGRSEYRTRRGERREPPRARSGARRGRAAARGGARPFFARVAAPSSSAAERPAAPLVAAAFLAAALRDGGRRARVAAAFARRPRGRSGPWSRRPSWPRRSGARGGALLARPSSPAWTAPSSTPCCAAPSSSAAFTARAILGRFDRRPLALPDLIGVLGALPRRLARPSPSSAAAASRRRARLRRGRWRSPACLPSGRRARRGGSSRSPRGRTRRLAVDVGDLPARLSFRAASTAFLLGMVLLRTCRGTNAARSKSIRRREASQAGLVGGDLRQDPARSGSAGRRA